MADHDGNAAGAATKATPAASGMPTTATTPKPMSATTKKVPATPTSATAANTADDGLPVRPSRRLVALLSLAILAIAIAGYAATGWPSLLRPGATAALTASAAAPSPDATASGPMTPEQQIAAMVDGLAARMQKNPNDAEGWTMLARSYSVLGRFADAVPAYARASALEPNNVRLLSDYADAIAATKGTANNPESAALIERALKLDPKHPKALALAGSIAYERGDYGTAVADWEQFAAQLPPGSELHERVQATIAEARQRAAGGASNTSSPPATTTTNNNRTTTAAAAPATSAVAATNGTSAAGASITGTVSLDPALASQVSPSDPVFVFARPATGPRMPLAVLRATVKDLPLTFKLDDSMAMAPGRTLSSASRVTVGARISKSGNPIGQPGDLVGEMTDVAPGAAGLAIRITSVVGKP